VGSSRWIVHRNNGAGFDPPADFRLPTAPFAGAFTQLEHPATTCPGRQPAYRLFDIDGDRNVDLVITEACEDARIGTTAWRVHRGTGTSFTDIPALFPLPTSPAPIAKMFKALSAEAVCSQSSLARSYRLVDLDGDFAPELLVTSLCNDALVGSTRWLVYRNSHAGFAESPENFPLPVVPGSIGVRNLFANTSGTAACAKQHPSFSMLDVTGDFRPDLLVTRACGDATTGVSRWLLYRSGAAAGNNFEAPVGITLPLSLGATAASPLDLRAELSCHPTFRPALVASYLDGPSLSLVATEACQDTSVGTLKWLIYQPQCQP
jgi:hypothetical protein